jgi:hypothetical protein
MISPIHHVNDPCCSPSETPAEKLERIYLSGFSEVSEDMKTMANVVLGLTEYLELEYLK